MNGIIRVNVLLEKALILIFPVGFFDSSAHRAIVWRSMHHPFEESVIFRYAYVTIAFLVWPTLAPLAALATEARPARKPFWKVLLLYGVGLTLYLIAKLLASNGIETTINGHSLQYEVAYDQEPPPFAAFAHVTITMLSFLLDDNKIIRRIGVAILIAFFYSIFKMRAVWRSVWRMSTAVFSSMFALAIRGEERGSIRSKRGGDSDAVLQ